MIIYMYRWKDTHPDTVTSGQWYEWRIGSSEKIEEIRQYIAQGKAYQIATFEQVNLEGYEVEKTLAHSAE